MQTFFPFLNLGSNPVMYANPVPTGNINGRKEETFQGGARLRRQISGYREVTRHPAFPGTEGISTDWKRVRDTDARASPETYCVRHLGLEPRICFQSPRMIPSTSKFDNYRVGLFLIGVVFTPELPSVVSCERNH